jgi:hypothetical protein
MRRLHAIAAALLLGSTIAGAQGDPPKPDSAKVMPVNIVGSWYGSISTPNGNQDVTVTIKKDSTGYSGTMASPQGEIAIYDVKLEGEKLQFGATVSTPNGNLDLWYTFTVKDDTMTGQIDGSFGGQAFSLPLSLKKSS